VAPELAARRHVAELGGDAHEVAAPAHAALDQVADAEFRSDLRHGDGLALVGEGGVARDDEEPANFRQRRDDVLADCVGKIFLLLFAAHVGKGEDGDGRLVGPRLSAACELLRLAECGGSATGLTGPCPHTHRADEADAPARDGADQLLLLAVVAHRLARGVDTACESRVRNDPTTPNRAYEIVPADDPIAVLHKVNEQIEYLRLDRDGRRAAAKLAPRNIKYMIRKEKLHFSSPGDVV